MVIENIILEFICKIKRKSCYKFKIVLFDLLPLRQYAKCALDHKSCPQELVVEYSLVSFQVCATVGVDHPWSHPEGYIQDEVIWISDIVALLFLSNGDIQFITLQSLKEVSVIKHAWVWTIPLPLHIYTREAQVHIHHWKENYWKVLLIIKKGWTRAIWFLDPYVPPINCPFVCEKFQRSLKKLVFLRYSGTVEGDTITSVLNTFIIAAHVSVTIFDTLAMNTRNAICHSWYYVPWTS